MNISMLHCALVMRTFRIEGIYLTEADPGFFLGGGAPLRNGVTDW